MKKKVLFALVGLFFFSLFVIFSALVHKDVFDQFDFDTTVRLQDHISRRFDEPFSLFSLLGSFEVTSVSLLVFLVIRRKWRGMVVPIFFVSLHIIEILGKAFVTHLGPPFMFLRYRIEFFFPSSYVQPGYSYPSGHSARTIFLSSLIIFFLLKSKRLSPLPKAFLISGVLLFDFLMLTSRVYLGEHWTSDVIGGALLGLSLALISEAFF